MNEKQVLEAQSSRKIEDVVKPINVWDTNATKNRLEDSIRSLLTNNHDVVERFGIFNVRLLFSFIAICFPAVALSYDKLHPFPQSKTVLMVCVISYFVCIGILSLYMYFVENGCFFQGNMYVVPAKISDCEEENDETAIVHEPNFIKIELRSRIQRYDPTFNLNVRFWNAQGKREQFDRRFSVADVFEQTGCLCDWQLAQLVKRVLEKVEDRYDRSRITRKAK